MSQNKNFNVQFFVFVTNAIMKNFILFRENDFSRCFSTKLNIKLKKAAWSGFVSEEKNRERVKIYFLRTRCVFTEKKYTRTKKKNQNKSVFLIFLMFIAWRSAMGKIYCLGNVLFSCASSLIRLTFLSHFNFFHSLSLS